MSGVFNNFDRNLFSNKVSVCSLVFTATFLLIHNVAARAEVESLTTLTAKSLSVNQLTRAAQSTPSAQPTRVAQSTPTAQPARVAQSTPSAQPTSVAPPASARAANAPVVSAASGKVSNLVERPRRDLFSPMKLETMDATTHEIAEQLEILPLLQELYGNPRPSEQRKILLRQKIQETILESFFDAQSVAAEAEREQARLALIRETLIAKRDRNVEVNNAGNFIASGALNTVGAALGFSKNANPFSGNLNQMMSGVVSTGMSTYALKQQAGGKTTGQGQPTILAELFGRPTDFRTAYPESVWRFLHGKSLDHPEKSRVELLEERWISRHYLEPHGSALEQAKLNAMCGKAGGRLTINDLSDEISMVDDVSGMTELMTHHLRDLLRMIDSDIAI